MTVTINQTATVDLVIAQGATFTAVYTWKIDDVAVNLTGYTGACSVKDTYGGTLLVAPTVTLGGAAGTITVTLTATQTGALSAPADGVYDVEVTSGATVRRIVQGAVRITPQVTT